ncbi:MAG: hypothetical protein Q9183_005351, partial [Haloplaca sp. 2 TL-2023]
MTIIKPTSQALLQSQCASQKEQLVAQQQELARIRENDRERTRLFDNFGMELKKIRAMAEQGYEDKTSKTEDELRDRLSIAKCKNAGLEQRLEAMTKEKQYHEQQYRELAAGCSQEIEESREQVVACHRQKQQIEELDRRLRSTNEELRVCRQETQSRDQQFREQVTVCHKQKEQIKGLRKEFQFSCEQARRQYSSLAFDAKESPVFKYTVEAKDREIAELKQKIDEMREE